MRKRIQRYMWVRHYKKLNPKDNLEAIT